MNPGRGTRDSRDVFARNDAYMRKLAKGYARGRPEFQEDLLQEARLALFREVAGGEEVAEDYRGVLMGAMQDARRRDLRHVRRFSSLDAMLDAQERSARAEEADDAEHAAWSEWIAARWEERAAA